jgi:4-alpha-glucanotransferase
VVPLFAVRTARNWGLGEILDLVPLAAWAVRMGHTVVQLLPVNETGPAEASPYTAMSAFAIDPLYLTMDGVADLQPHEWRRPQALARGLGAGAPLPRRAIRDAKLAALGAAWGRFQNEHQRRGTERAARFAAFVERARHWLDDYALFRALKEEHRWRAAAEWGEVLESVAALGIAAARQRLAARMAFFRYVQWLLDEQWQEMRTAVRALGVRIMGDLPFVVGRDSADVWSQPGLFVPGWEIGAPPDDFSADGQNWSLPLYDWLELRHTNFAWWRARLRHAAALYDVFRLDHIVGVFRTYGIPFSPDAPRRFHPQEEAEQIAQGEAFLDMVRAECGAATPIVEDLGTVPDFVRGALQRRGLPGYKVLRWQRRDGRFLDPRAYERASVATSGTHDTTTLAEWWARELPVSERNALLAALGLPADPRAVEADALDPVVRRLLLKRLYEAGSDLVMLPVQDLFGWSERINVPRTPSVQNWNYQLPFELGPHGEVPADIEREGAALRALVDAARRAP